jgi:AcrR family transcriptional regulator
MSELVERSGAPAATVRFYLAEGLLPSPTRAQANRYLYDERHVEIVRIVRILRERRGLSLEEIRRLLPELLPDLIGSSGAGLFRPEMFDRLIPGAPGGTARPSVSALLVEAGREAFSARGIADVSIDDICRAVKIAKGSFYRHFASKEDLFIAATGRVPGLFSASYASGESAEDALRPHLSLILELASLAGRDHEHDRYRSALGALLDGLAGALEPAHSQAILLELLGRIVVELGGRAAGTTSSLADRAHQ